MLPLIIITGPTASGKSKIAVDVAKKVGGEIISADSLQVYRYFDILSDKPDKNTREQIPHHLIDIIDPDEEFNASIFKSLACSTAEAIVKHGKMPVLCGGTGLYIRGLIEDFSFCGRDNNVVEKKEMPDFLTKETALLYSDLKKIDPYSAAKINPSDRYRIIRSLEVFHTTRSVMSRHHKNEKSEKKFDYKYIILNRERKDLYKRINKRVENMMEKGALEEIKSILDLGYEDSLKPFKAIGPAQLVKYLKGEITYDIAVSSIQQATRHYAKRQLTWFRGVEEAIWLDVPQEITEEKLSNEVIRLIQKK